MILRHLALRAVARNFRRNRSDAIARQAGVSEGMIFFCFKTKERLYREVRRRRLAEVPRTDRVDMNPAAGAAV
jgi:AcrR family transcriptional regulator